jgi:hypothetical protein
MILAFSLVGLFWGTVILLQIVRGKPWTHLLAIFGLILFAFLALKALSTPDWLLATLLVAIHLLWIGATLKSTPQKAIALPSRLGRSPIQSSRQSSFLEQLPMRPAEHHTGLFTKTFHLTLTTDVKNAEALEQNLSDYKTALLSWFQLRRGRVGSIRVVVIAPPEIHESLISVLQRICREDADYSRAFAHGITTFSILDETGFLRQKFEFNPKDKVLTLLCSCGPGQYFGDVRIKAKAIS